jgi:hypothetical protein
MEKTNFASNSRFGTFYKVVGILAILIVLAGLTDAITSMGVAAQDNRSIQITEWFTLFQTHRFEAFSRLGIINMLTLSLSIPIYLAFNMAFRTERPILAAFASILFFIGTAVYLSSNTVFALFAVSQQYSVASVAQKPILEMVGQNLLQQGADLTTGTFFGLFLTQIAGLLITSAMLRGKIFGKWIGSTGLSGYIVMTAFFILTAFFPEQYSVAMLVAAPGGLILMAYEIMLARKFFQHGSAEGRTL